MMGISMGYVGGIKGFYSKNGQTMGKSCDPKDIQILQAVIIMVCLKLQVQRGFAGENLGIMGL